MHPALFFESFFFCSRNNLERLQPLSRLLLNMIANGSKDCWDPEDVIHICVVERCNMQPDYEASIHADFAEIFLRLQNTCIRRFGVAIRDSPFRRYWNAEETASFTVLRIDFHLPRSMNCRWKRLSSAGILPQRARIPDLRAGVLLRNVADGVDDLIESFVRDGCSNTKLKSVYIKCDEGGEDRSSPAPKQLSKPTKIDMPFPKINLTYSLTCDDDETQCEIHSFENTKQWKQMEVYKWTVEYDCGFRPGGGCFRKTIHILQCHMKNL
ncbi:hypothetical protein AAVH_34359 [Aphelenchoides avenae]|nr:hypothetical protein AAVH_34359 [Aphelenchus avenae]